MRLYAGNDTGLGGKICAKKNSDRNFFGTKCVRSVFNCVQLQQHYSVASMTRGSLALFSPAIETLPADSRGLTCCPEEGTTFGGRVVVVEELKPTAISIY